MQAEVLYIVINLPRAESRRLAMQQQLEQLGLSMCIAPAVAGADLSPDSPTGYDAATRARYFTNDLLPNEIACAMSHRNALKIFLDSKADYAVIMEDDAVLAPNFNEGIRELIEHIHGWEAAKLFTDDGKLYPLEPHCEGAEVQAVFPKKLPWVAVGYLYTRSAAEKVYTGLSRFWLPADAQIGQTLLRMRIPTIGVTPGLIHSGDPDNTQSTLDATGSRRARQPKRSLLSYIAYRAFVISTALAKRRMRKLMSRRLSRR